MVEDKSEAEEIRIPARQQKRWIYIVLACASLFLLGAVAGSVATGRFMHHRTRQLFLEPDIAAHHLLSRMRKDLDLSDEQAKDILEVLKTHHRLISDMMRKEHDAMLSEIEQYLNEKQRDEHRRRIRELEDHFSRPEKHGHRPSGK